MADLTGGGLKSHGDRLAVGRNRRLRDRFALRVMPVSDRNHEDDRQRDDRHGSDPNDCYADSQGVLIVARCISIWVHGPTLRPAVTSRDTSPSSRHVRADARDSGSVRSGRDTRSSEERPSAPQIRLNPFGARLLTLRTMARGRQQASSWRLAAIVVG